MNRREFLKYVGAGGVLIGLGALVGAGCGEEEEEETPPDLPEEPPTPPADNGAAG